MPRDNSDRLLSYNQLHCNNMPRIAANWNSPSLNHHDHLPHHLRHPCKQAQHVSLANLTWFTAAATVLHVPLTHTVVESMRYKSSCASWLQRGKHKR